ncbi:sulfite exporter TauE/SafE family protein [Roseobacter sp. CCS2]|uniref:sulfite exporter TauE/SafE family protein n=1 Tax=Roseobacter sp. CCS2 TaxID=391593 RepID=UPI0000F4058C|nr:sulfite exporter TauE/SafE family protein [Roseobacter sp. CCS2]EBA11298.1 hypothetical protein RCCS2_01528 [Roseobacter sp. CCS2]
MIDFAPPSFLLIIGAILLATGALSGLLAGLLGVGGGMFVVPVLFFLFGALNVPNDVAMHLAVATSLATIIPISVSSARAHYIRGALDTHLFRSWAPFIFVGAALGGLASKYVDGAQLTVIFGAIALIVALTMAAPKGPVIADSVPSSVLPRSLIGSVIGLLSALMGIGGGTLSVPILTLFSFPVKRAIGTAAAFGIVIAVPAVIGFVWSGLGVADRPPWSLGNVNMPAAVIVVVAAIFTAPIGARMSHAIDPTALRFVFSGFLFVTSIYMLREVL